MDDSEEVGRDSGSSQDSRTFNIDLSDSASSSGSVVSSDMGKHYVSRSSRVKSSKARRSTPTSRPTSSGRRGPSSKMFDGGYWVDDEADEASSSSMPSSDEEPPQKLSRTAPKKRVGLQAPGSPELIPPSQEEDTDPTWNESPKLSRTASESVTSLPSGPPPGSGTGGEYENWLERWRLHAAAPPGSRPGSGAHPGTARAPSSGAGDQSSSSTSTTDTRTHGGTSTQEKKASAGTTSASTSRGTSAVASSTGATPAKPREESSTSHRLQSSSQASNTQPMSLQRLAQLAEMLRSFGGGSTS